MKLRYNNLVLIEKHSMSSPTIQKRKQKRYNVPVIGHFANKSVRFNSIIEAEEYTGISYTLIFEACVGKIYKARNVYWEFENGIHYLKYKSFYLQAKIKLEEGVGHGHGHSKSNKELEEHNS